MNFKLIVFLIINIGALVIGSFLMDGGPQSVWYQTLNKAPWTPPGWVFGTSWSIIMICFSFYMAYLWPMLKNKKTLICLFTLQWILNVGWNPTFFYYEYVLAGFIIIIGLTVLIGFILLSYWTKLKLKSILILPYLIWLLIATSLNGYILFYN